MNLSFCYQSFGFSRNKAAQVFFFFTLGGDPNNAGRRFLGLLEISFSVLSQSVEEKWLYKLSARILIIFLTIFFSESSDKLCVESNHPLVGVPS